MLTFISNVMCLGRSLAVVIAVSVSCFVIIMTLIPCMCYIRHRQRRAFYARSAQPVNLQVFPPAGEAAVTLLCSNR